MIVVKIELHSARDGHVEELGRMLICNDGTSRVPTNGSYNVYLGKKGQKSNQDVYCKPLRTGRVENYPRQTYSVWQLIRRAMGAAKMPIQETAE